MRIKVPPDDASVLEMNDWIAELRADGRAEPARDGGHGRPVPGATAVTPPTDRPTASAEKTTASAEKTTASAEKTTASAEPTERAAIGDQLRTPIAWCEMGSCISHHADPAALGEADIRARAISVGWRLDGLGRLACPSCQQSGPGFWASHPVALWDRNVAITRAYLMAVAMRNDAVADDAEKGA